MHECVVGALSRSYGDSRPNQSVQTPPQEAPNVRFDQDSLHRNHRPRADRRRAHPRGSAVAASGGGIANANAAADHGDGVFTAKLRRDPAAADPFFVQTPSSGQHATGGELSTLGSVAVVGGVALAVTAIVMTAGASSDRRRTASAQPGTTARIV